jgi:NADH-quinone oxidoreductase subunit L
MTRSVVVGLAAALPLVPLAAALVGLLLPLAARRAAVTLAVGAAAVAFLAAVALAVGFQDPVQAAYKAADFVDLSVHAGVRVEGATVLVSLAVGAVALAVQVYSVAYLRDDERYVPYAAQVSLFTAAMFNVVVATDLIQLLVGWEVMGICSYLLIGHDRRLPEAPRAAVKAFLVTRVGDVGFLLGIVLLGYHAGSFRIDDVFAADLSDGVLTAACLLLLAGVAGKSAQFPLHTWLPDAMAGPTPISALIHAATMVAAGVYVVAVLFPLFAAAPAALTVLGVMAAITMVLGAAAALGQDDIKRVLAWSTVSQLGYMTGALAVHAPAAALFHLLTHAAFKALLFLAAGAVIHAVGSNLVAVMGGLRAPMRATFVATTIGLAALAGLPPLAGFWSKEAVLAAAEHGDAAVAWLVYGAGLLTVLLTGWYATRLWLRTFFGEPRSEAARHAHEPPPAMLWPVLALAVPAALLGFAALASGFGRRLGDTDLGHLEVGALVPLAATIAGCALAWQGWRRRPAAAPAATGVLAEAFYLDAVQHAVAVRPVLAVARLVRRGDETGVDGAVRLTGRAAVSAGGLLAWAHRAALPRAATAALAGALLLGVAALVVEAVR